MLILFYLKIISKKSLLFLLNIHRSEWREGEVMSIGRVTRVSEMYRTAGTAGGGAGCTDGSVQDAAAGSGWQGGSVRATRAWGTIGVRVATKAGGTRVHRYGMPRRRVAG